jgi:hypothetical protein
MTATFAIYVPQEQRLSAMLILPRGGMTPTPEEPEAPECVEVLYIGFTEGLQPLRFRGKILVLVRQSSGLD